jgi:hypothetical protein
MAKCPRPPLIRSQIGVVENDRNIRKSLRETPDIIRVSIAGSAVTCDRTSASSSKFQVRIKPRIVGTIVVDCGMQLKADSPAVESLAHFLERRPARSNPDQWKELRRQQINSVERAIVDP